MRRVLLVCLALILFLAVSCAPEAEQPPSNNEQEEKPPVDSGNETEEPKEETNSSNISGIVGESGAYTIPESIFKVEKTLSYALENIDKGVESINSTYLNPSNSTLPNPANLTYARTSCPV